jgi:DNA-binding PadR family transcriptional regulator
MKDKGLLSSKTEKDSNKVEKTIYSITTKGKSEFKTYIKSVCDFNYKPEFLNDALFFFSDSIDQNQIYTVLEQYIGKLEKEIKSLQEHRNFVKNHLSNEELIMSSHIFNHHEVHFKAELKWAKDVLIQFEKYKTQL